MYPGLHSWLTAFRSGNETEFQSNGGGWGRRVPGLERQLGWEWHPARDGVPQVESRTDSTFLPASRTSCHSGHRRQPRGWQGQVRRLAPVGQLERT